MGCHVLLQGIKLLLYKRKYVSHRDECPGHYLDFGDDSACVHTQRGFPGGSDGKESACKGETWVQSLGQEDTLKKGMATHSNTLAWRIPWREEPGEL